MAGRSCPTRWNRSRRNPAWPTASRLTGRPPLAKLAMSRYLNRAKVPYPKRLRPVVTGLAVQEARKLQRDDEGQYDQAESG